MKDGRLQELLPKQLEQPLDATRPPSRSERQMNRDMIDSPAASGSNDPPPPEP